MRIIAGSCKRRILAAPPDGSVTRPITDRVKENLFNSLMARGVLGEGRVLDIFAGVGSLGLEALSRGAEHCTFVERHREIRQFLTKNISDLRLEDCAAVLAVDALAVDWISQLNHKSVQLIFLDPPYALAADERMHSRIERLMIALAQVADAETTMVLRTHLADPFGEVANWRGPEKQVHGQMLLHYYDGATMQSPASASE